jgi:ABC-type sugar transport system substrate-binding protein
MKILKCAIAGMLALCFLFAGVVFSAEKPAAGDQTIDVLIIGSFSPDVRDPWWPQLQQAAAKRGVRLNILGEGTRGESNAFERFTVDFLKQFHVVIFNGEPSADLLAGGRTRP